MHKDIYQDVNLRLLRYGKINVNPSQTCGATGLDISFFFCAHPIKMLRQNKPESSLKWGCFCETLDSRSIFDFIWNIYTFLQSMFDLETPLRKMFDWETFFRNILDLQTSFRSMFDRECSRHILKSCCCLDVLHALKHYS